MYLYTVITILAQFIFKLRKT